LEKEYEEDEDCYIINTSRPPDIIADLRSIGAPEEMQRVSLAFPKNYDFIKVIRSDRLKRLTKHGLNKQKLLVFEMPYVTTYTKDIDPVLALVSFQVVMQRRSYFRTMVFTDAYVNSCHVAELEDTIPHESTHLKEDEASIQKGKAIRKEEDYLACEERIGKLVKRQLIAKYGTRIVEQVENDSLLQAFQEQSKRKTISSGYLDYWIHKLLKDKFDVFKDAAVPMTDAIKHGDYVKDMEKEFASVRAVYLEFFNCNLPAVW
jgi:hypothetical protein